MRICPILGKKQRMKFQSKSKTVQFLIFCGILLVCLIWGGAFLYLSLNIHGLISGLCLLIIGVLSSFVLAYWAGVLYRGYKRDQKFHFLRQALSALTPTIEAVMFNRRGRVVWTTHPNAYPDLTEFKRKTLARILDPVDIERIGSMLDRGQHGEALFCGKNRSDSTDQRWYIFTLAVFSRANMIVVLRDVTEHFTAYHQLKNAHQRLETLIDTAPVGIFDQDPQGKILGINATLCRWLGADKASIVENPITTYIQPEEGYPGLVQITPLPQSLKPFPAFLLQPIQESSAHNHPSIICRLPQMENVLGSRLMNDFIFMDAALPTLLVNAQGGIIRANPAFLNLCGDMDTDGCFISFIDPAYQGDVQERLKHALITEQSPIPFDIHFKDGLLHATAYPSRVVNRVTQQPELMIQLIDISEQKRLEEQFIQSQKMQAVGQLAGGVAHDFNNLLTAMIGYCDLLLQRYLPNNPSYNDVMQIKQNANRASNLVRQLLAFSRQQTLQPKTVIVTDYLVELSFLLRRLIGASIELSMYHAHDLWPVKVDISQLEQVIINLVVNARDAMSHGGTLTIRTSNMSLVRSERHGHDLIPQGDYVVIEVVDSGCGIPAEYMGQIFEPFFSTKGVGEGTGLGLSTVYGIVKQTGGFVKVNSTVQHGTTFKIMLPRFHGVLDQDNPKHGLDTRDLTGAGTILLVEDEDAVRMFAARALREKGYTVLEAENGESALEFVHGDTDFDLLITDVVMPRMDGPALVREVRQYHTDIATIFISGYTEDTFRSSIDFHDHIYFLPKPFTLKELASKVKEALRLRQELQEGALEMQTESLSL